MSLDITVYKDPELEISANVGTWGTRLYITQLNESGSAVIPTRDFITSRKLDAGRLDEMILRLQKIRDQLKGDYSFDLVKDLRDYSTIEFLEEIGGDDVES